MDRSHETTARNRPSRAAADPWDDFAQVLDQMSRFVRQAAARSGSGERRRSRARATEEERPE
ncbi:hypothetical protein ACWDYJ_31890 [Streptomyces sp. NPDC003042]